ncbi:MAG: exodeoxyribonuclease VII large subunit [Oscillospiraceae bacterium]|jgi:exodeoxyribonuclease VII large subunit|nr:exodeoxyribonuclease VII large subunit [Oscillospiraceae bacterium]
MQAAKVSVFTVSDLNFLSKSALEQCEYLQNVLVEGEVSNFKDHYISGHFYFSLKDDKSVVKCVMFSDFSKNLRFTLKNGMKVILRGRVSIYEATGLYQIYVEDICSDGTGSLQLAFDELKKKLSFEGLFLQENKKEIPSFPKKIGILTSKTGSVLYDILNVLKRRYPVAEILFYPVSVQGSGSAEIISKTLLKISKNNDVDVVIIGRGGGSLEDLWTFNEEILARAVFACKIPVISAVGHETDFTICDFVADLRAPTPSVAAELATPEVGEIILKIKYLFDCLKNGMLASIRAKEEKVRFFEGEKFSNNFIFKLQEKLIKLDFLKNKIQSIVRDKFLFARENFVKVSVAIDSFSPFRILVSGYIIALKKDKNIKSIEEIIPGDRLMLRFFDGIADCSIISSKRVCKIGRKSDAKYFI